MSEAFTRINVIGTSGSGKSTLACQLAEKLDLPYVEIDALHWKPNWVVSTDEELFPKVREAISGDNWVLDGNFTQTIEFKWERVQLVVWIDLPFLQTLYRVVRRTFMRLQRKEVLWSGNRESLWRAFFSRDSIIYWCVTTYYPTRKLFTAAMKDPAFTHIEFVRLRSTKAVREFRDGFGNGSQ